MILSTSRSKYWGATLLGSLVISCLLAWGYCFWVDPEIRFFKAAFKIKTAWVEEFRHDRSPVTVFSGGSTTGFQVDAALLVEEYDLPSVNAGFHAGMGLDGTVAFATRGLQKGDRLVLMTEPSLLVEGGGEFTPLASKMLAATGGIGDAFVQSAIPRPSYWQLLLQCRPGFTHSVTMAAKWIARRPSYRYQIEELKDGGLLTTVVRRDIGREFQGVASQGLSPKAVRFLHEIKAWAEAKGIEVVYLMPVSHIPPSSAEEQRRSNRRLMEEIAAIVPVLTDAYQGVWPIAEDFADTALHMTPEAAQARTRAIGAAFLRHQRK